jgi:FMN-dependent NADH-azoreductase
MTMKNVLKIISSPRGEASFSNKLSDAIIEKIRAVHPGIEVTTLDLNSNPYPHLEAAQLNAFFTPVDKRSAEHHEAALASDTAVDELLNADAIVIAVPMYNFSVPSVLKAWIDHISRQGSTFSYTEKGPEGLVKGKKVYIALASGGIYSEGFMKDFDFAEPYLKAVLSFLGMKDVTTIRVEGVSMPGVQDTALQKAIDSIVI